MNISYAIPVCNELQELKRLVGHLIKHRQDGDEVVIVFDTDNGTDEVKDYIIHAHNTTDDLHWYEHSLNKDFAKHKNFLNSCCSNDWIFQIDADEYPDEYLIHAIPYVIKNNPEVEAYWVSRINTVNGLTDAHINQWGWTVNDRGWVNFPDMQMRLYKNSDNINWVKPVHEQLVGYKKFSQLPGNEEYCLRHPKEIDRQERQNKFYGEIS